MTCFTIKVNSVETSLAKVVLCILLLHPILNKLYSKNILTDNLKFCSSLTVCLNVPC